MARNAMVTAETFQSKDPLVAWLMSSPRKHATTNIPQMHRGGRTKGDANRFRKQLVQYLNDKEKSEKNAARGRTKEAIQLKRLAKKEILPLESIAAPAESPQELVPA